MVIADGISSDLLTLGQGGGRGHGLSVSLTAGWHSACLLTPEGGTFGHQGIAGCQRAPEGIAGYLQPPGHRWA